MNIKKIFIFIAFLTLPFGISHAETAKQPETTPAPVSETVLTASQRKEKAQTDLTALEAQFRLFVSRTQATTVRLSAKGVDTTLAQTELTAATTSLDSAKIGLTTLSTIEITDTMSEEAPEKTLLKATLTNIQDNLKDARAHLIASLVALKASISASISE